MTTETIEDTGNPTCYDTSATELRELVFVIVSVFRLAVTVVCYLSHFQLLTEKKAA